jgi:hypothetical protein
MKAARTSKDEASRPEPVRKNPAGKAPNPKANSRLSRDQPEVPTSNSFMIREHQKPSMYPCARTCGIPNRTSSSVFPSPRPPSCMYPASCVQGIIPSPS